MRYKNHKFALTIVIMSLCFVQCIKDIDSPANVEVYNCSGHIINNHPDSSKFQTFLDEKVSEGLPGISMLIETTEGIWTGASGMANVAKSVKMQSCSQHQVGSITKMLTASLIHQLAEAGLLNYEDLIEAHLDPDIIDRLPNGDKVTIYHLLNHASGIPDYLNIEYSLEFYNNPTKASTALRDISFVYDETPEFEPGAKIQYSNINYALLGLVAEAITGRTGEAMIQEMIFDKIGMDNSRFSQSGEKPQSLVRGYYDESGRGHFIDITSYKPFIHSMAGGAISTVTDLYTFMHASLVQSDFYQNSTRDLFWNIADLPYDDPDKFEFGDAYEVRRIAGFAMGWFQLDTTHGKAIGHNGGLNGRRARMWYFPDSHSTIIFMHNGSGNTIDDVEDELFKNEMIELLFEF